jgi:hypothetical protein
MPNYLVWFALNSLTSSLRELMLPYVHAIPIGVIFYKWLYFFSKKKDLSC